MIDHLIWYKLADPIGMIGVVTILIAYFMLSTGKWISDSMLFQFLNCVGAILILYSLYFHWNTSSVVIEVAWVFISLIGMYIIYKKNKSAK
jgi:hypothetical protein